MFVLKSVEQRIEIIKETLEARQTLLARLPSFQNEDWNTLSKLTRTIREESYDCYVLAKADHAKQNEMAWAFELAVRFNHSKAREIWKSCFTVPVCDIDKPYDNAWIAFLNGCCEQGVDLLQTAALVEQNAGAQYYLGMMCLQGLGVPKDESKACEWFEKAAEQGHVTAQYNLGVMYQYGLGVLKDRSKACKWYQKAAEQGYAYAQYNLGVMYNNGLGVPKNKSKACEWYQKAAEQGQVNAQFNLGLLYSHPQGVERDAIKAMGYFRLAAEQKYEQAEHKLKNFADSVNLQAIGHYHLAMLKRQSDKVAHLLKSHKDVLLPIVNEFEFKEYLNLSNASEILLPVIDELKNDVNDLKARMILNHLYLGLCKLIVNHDDEQILPFEFELVKYFTQLNPTLFSDELELTNLLSDVINHWYRLTSIDSLAVLETHDNYARCIVHGLKYADVLSLSIDTSTLLNIAIILLKSRYPEVTSSVSPQSISFARVMRLLTVSARDDEQLSFEDAIKFSGLVLTPPTRCCDGHEQNSEYAPLNERCYPDSLSMFSSKPKCEDNNEDKQQNQMWFN